MPFLAFSCRCPHGMLALRVPFPWVPVPMTLTRSLGPMAYSARLLRCPGCPLLSTHISPATLPAGQYSPAPYKKVRAFVQHQQPNDILLVNLTNPLTVITLTPGFLGWDSLLPPNHSFAPCIPHSLHSHSGPLTHIHSPYFFLGFLFLFHITLTLY